jgi:predicted transcriptional regulator
VQRDATSVEAEMKRDLDLIRKLLFYFEEKSGPEVVENPVIEGYDESTIQYHLRLMHDAHLINCETERSSTSPDRIIRVLPFDLTWEGHEFLTKVRSETTWRHIKDTLKTKGGGMAFAVVNELATKLALKAIVDA